MNPLHTVPTYVENLSRMLQVHEHPLFNPDYMRALQAHVNSLFAQQPDFGGVQGIEAATLVLFRNPEHAGTVGSTVKQIVQLPLYFQEIKPFAPLSAQQLQQRLTLALETGHLLLGRDEALAVLHESDGGYIFCGTFESNSDGVARSLAGYYADNVIRESRPRSIADLNITDTRRAIADTVGTMYWWAGQKLAFNQQQSTRMRTTLDLLKAHELVAPDERTASGAVIRRSFIENGNTGSVAHLVPRASGWRRYGTSQDAWYYGCWINERTLQTLTYAEQDVSHVICENYAQFHAELKAMAQHHGRHRTPSAMGYGETGSTAFFDTLFLMQGNHRSIRFDTGLSVKDGENNWNVPMFGALALEHPATLALTKDRLDPIPPDAFELDVLNPQSFVPHTAYARLTDSGYTIEVKFVDGTVLRGQMNLQAEDA